MKLHNVNALVVDDNPVNLKVISKSLSFYGMTVECVSSGAESIELCKKNEYDFIFMDQMMPEMDGVEAMKIIRKSITHYFNNGYIIALTANAISGVKQELLNEGFDEYISKPIVYPELEEIFKKYINPTQITYEESASDEVDQNMLSKLLPSINVGDGLSHCANNIDSFVEVLPIFLRSGKEQIEKLRKSKEDNNLKDFAIYAHAFKGGCLNIGASLLAEKAKGLELAGKADDSSYIDSNFEEYISEFEKFLAEIDSAIDRLGLNSSNNQTSDIQASDFQASDNDKNPSYQLLVQVKKALDDYDFATATNLLKDIKTD